MEVDRKALLLVFYATLLLCTSANVPCVTYNLTLSLEEAIHVSDIVMTGRAIGPLEEGERGTLKGRVSYYFAYKNDTQLHRLWLGSTDVNNFHSAEKTGEIALFFLFREPNGALALQCMSPFSMLVPRRRAGGGGQTSQATGQSSSLSALLHLVERVGRADNKINSDFESPSPSPCEVLSPCARRGSFCSLRNALPSEDYRCACLTGFVGDGKNCTSLVDEEVTETPPTTATPPSYNCSECLFGAECLSSSLLTACTCSHIQCTEAPPLPNETTPTSRDPPPTVCGSDYETYPSPCVLRRKECERQEPIYKLHDGPCVPGGMRPCGGAVASPPLVVEGGLVTCGLEGECPSMHFCHETQQYSVCCPVMQPTPTASVSHTSSTTTTTTSSIPVPTVVPESASGSGFDTFSGSGFVATETTDSLLDDEDYMEIF